MEQRVRDACMSTKEGQKHFSVWLAMCGLLFLTFSKEYYDAHLIKVLRLVKKLHKFTFYITESYKGST